MRTLVLNGTVINADGRVEADVAIGGERIVAIVPRSAGGITPSGDDKVVDAGG